MCLSDIDAQIAATEAEILSLQSKLVHLRHQRNTLVPLCALPPELVTKILKILADDAAAATLINAREITVDRDFNPYRWTSVTQFCAYWRNLALDCPSLWTTIVAFPRQPQWFTLFMKRSKDQLLYVDTWKGGEDRDRWHRIFVSIAANMRRIRSLCIRPTSYAPELYRLRNMAASELTTLRLASREDMARFLPSVSDPANANVMPKLTRLEVAIRSGFIWNILLPSHLPTVTNVILHATHAQDQLNILRRCTAVQNLTISGSHGRLNQNETLHVPNLEHLSISVKASAPLVQISFPSAKSIRIEWGINPYDIPVMDRALQVMPQFFVPFTNSNDLNTRIYYLSLSFHYDRISLVAENRDNTKLIQVHVRDFKQRSDINPLGYRNLLEGVARLSQANGFEIDSLEMEGRPELGLRALFAPFEHQSNVATIVLRNNFALIDFLSHSRTTCKQNQRSLPEPCNCTPCHEMRLTSFPCLATICLLGVGERVVVEYNGINWLELLLQWVKERKARDIGLEFVDISMRRCSEKFGQAVIDGLTQTVPKVTLFGI